MILHKSSALLAIKSPWPNLDVALHVTVLEYDLILIFVCLFVLFCFDFLFVFVFVFKLV